MSARIQNSMSIDPGVPRDFRAAGLRKRTRFLSGVLDVLLILIVVVSVLLVLDDSTRKPGESPTTAGSTTNAVISQQLPADPRDPLVAADISTVRAFKDALERELTKTESSLLAAPGQMESAKRRYAIQKMLTNAGGSGLNDRLAEIEKAISLSSSSGYTSTEIDSFIRKAIQDLHETAISCKTGPLSEAARNFGEATP